MESRLKLIADILEIILNFFVMMCAEAAAGAIFGRLSGLEYEESVWALMLPALAPLLFYGARKWVNRLALFLVIHIMIVAALFYMPPFLERYLPGLFSSVLFWRVIYLLAGIIYGIHSVRVRLTRSEDDEGEIGPLFAGSIAAAAFFACSYAGSAAGCAGILWIALLWISGYWIKNYLDNFLNYMKLNRKMAGAMPEKRILCGGMALVGGYAGFSLLILTMCSKTPFVQRLSDLVRKAGYLLLRLFFFLLSKFTWEPEEGAIAAENTGGQPQMMPGEGIAEPSLLARVLERILTAAAAALFIAGAVFLMLQAVRFILQRFYGRKKGRKETRQDGFVEEEERLKEPEGAQRRRLPLLGGTPAQRVRKIFKRTVREAFGKKEENQLAAKTARELADMNAGKNAEEWMALAALYERARYTQQTITRQEVREAGKLSRQILHTIK